MEKTEDTQAAEKQASEKSFEASLEQLEKIVENLEQGDVPLQEALNQFQEGVEISRHLKKQLDDADELLVKIMDEDGLEQPHDLDETK